MISIRKRLDLIDSYEHRLQAASDAYAAALEAVRGNLVPAGDDLLAEYQARLDALIVTVRSASALDVLGSTSRALESDLAAYRQKAAERLRQKDEDLREMVIVLAQAAEALNRNREEHGGRFRGFASRIEAVVRTGEVSEIRRRIYEEVAGLKTSIDSMCRDSAAAASQLESELAVYRRRLNLAEALAATDPLTGAANRREGERQIDRRIAERAQFSILFFDLDRFKSINDQYGHQAGDEVLKAFCLRLVSGIRAGDRVCRWGGDEFVVILECGLRDALGRARQLAGVFPVTVPSSQRGALGHSLSVSASAGVAEHLRGETRQQLFARADALLYRQKGTRRAM